MTCLLVIALAVFAVCPRAPAAEALPVDGLLHVAEMRLQTLPERRGATVRAVRTDGLERMPLFLHAESREEGTWWLHGVARGPGKRLWWCREEVAPEQRRMSAQSRLPLCVPKWALPLHRAFTAGGFEFVVFVDAQSELRSNTPVYRRNPPGWTVQRWDCLNHAFIREMRFAEVRSEHDGMGLHIVDGFGEPVIEAGVPTETVLPVGVADRCLMKTPNGYWGCLGQVSPAAAGEPPESRSLWVYQMPVTEDDHTRARIWPVPASSPWSDTPSLGDKVSESVAFGRPALAGQPSEGLLVWRRRELTLGSEGDAENLTILELIHWTPSETRVVDTYAHYRSASVRRAWYLDSRGEWVTDGIPRVHPLAAELGMREVPCAALSGDGRRALFLRNLELYCVSFGP